MKSSIHITAIIAMVFTCILNTSAKTDEKGHVLVKLWKEYNIADKEDRPKDKIRILDDIMEEASAKKLPWDHYDAGLKYLDAIRKTDWSRYRDEIVRINKEREDLGIPVEVFCTKRFVSGWDMAAFASGNKNMLMSSVNRPFYGVGGIYGRSNLEKMVRNDYEFVLWSSFFMHQSPALEDMIRRHYKDEYPFVQILDFYTIPASPESAYYDKIRTFARENEGRAASLLAEEKLLLKRFTDLNKDKDANSRDYEELAADCRDFEKRRNSFKGIEGLLAQSCTAVSSQLSTLEGSSLSFQIDENILTLITRNVKNADMKISMNGKTVYSRMLENQTGSFYRQDTLTHVLPDLEDGIYDITCKAKGIESKDTYSKHSLSVATRTNADGLGILVAGSKTGKPVRDFEIVLYDDEKRLGSACINGADGFTAIPDEIARKLKRGDSIYSIAVQSPGPDGKTLLSKKHYMYPDDPVLRPARTARSNDASYFQKNCIIIVDRAAFRPDETVNYKAVFFNGEKNTDVFDAGIVISAELHDPEGNIIEIQNIRTNDMGSAAGSFKLKRAKKNGRYRIDMKLAGKTLGSRWVSVDDFTPPAITLSWHKSARRYFPGDMVDVSGNIRSLAGRNLASAQMTYKVISGSSTISEGAVKAGLDGSFNISFKSRADSNSWYEVEVRLTDSTGETHEYATMVNVNSNLPLTADIINQEKGHASIKNGRHNTVIASDDTLRIDIGSKDYDGSYISYPGMKFSYILRQNGSVMRSAYGIGEGVQEIDMSSLPAGLYTLETAAEASSEDGSRHSARTYIDIIRCNDATTSIQAGIEQLFRDSDKSGSIGVQVGTPAGKSWVTAELYDAGMHLLDHKTVFIDGHEDAESLTRIAFDIKKSYPADMSMNIIFFRNGKSAVYVRSIKVSGKEYVMPLEFTRFQDLTSPGSRVSLGIKTAADVEIAAAVSDISYELITPNEWQASQRYSPGMSLVHYSTTCGNSGISGGEYAPFHLERGLMSKAMMLNDAVEVEEAAPAGGDSDIAVREDFRPTIAWEPFIRPDKDGNADFSFTAADKLTTYIVQLFAHDRNFNNAVLRREMPVTIPVSVSMATPSLLRSGDSYTARVTLSNCRSDAVTGTVSIKVFDGTDYKEATPVLTRSQKVSVPAGGEFLFKTDIEADKAGIVGILAAFKADRAEFGSDAVFLTIPVEKNTQTITESHSALLMDGSDREKLIRQLRSEFINSDGRTAEVKEVSILEMLKEAVPEKVRPADNSVLSNAEAMLAAHLLGQEISRECIDRILACRNSDRGFGWFSGMPSNTYVTACLLDIFARLEGDCPEDLSAFIPDAVRFLDSEFIRTNGNGIAWRGCISMEQYLYTRSLFADITTKEDIPSVLKAKAREYLTPEGDRGLKGEILNKARRVMTLKNIHGTPFAKALGFNVFTSDKINRSMNLDVESLVQYAVGHPSGGLYFPNAVMPWRGLLESEIYAHDLLCRLLESFGHVDEADGLRLWMMIQKETQQWMDDPAYIQALSTVMSGRSSLLNTKVIVLSSSSEMQLDKIMEGGNGMSISVSYTLDGTPVKEGQVIKSGSKVKAVYSIFNDENRSFVRIRAPRPAGFRPADQLSGWDYRSRGYRSVLNGYTEYWFDSYPEKDSTISEEFYVEQSGTFHAPAVEIESLYAPHYRANSRAQTVTSR